MKGRKKVKVNVEITESNIVKHSTLTHTVNSQAYMCICVYSCILQAGVYECVERPWFAFIIFFVCMYVFKHVSVCMYINK